MILTTGDKVLIVHRRLYDGDSPRFFTGEVDGYEAGMAKVRGHSWIRDFHSGELISKSDVRTKIFSLSSGSLIVYVLPERLDVDSLKMESKNRGQISLVGKPDFVMDLTEKSFYSEVNNSSGVD